LTNYAAVAQNQTSPPQKLEGPKIGLVLEGGAALGLAHVGVIRWLEEHRIPISYVAGTFQDTKLVAEYQNRLGGGAADFGYVPSRSSELRVGYEAADQKLYPAVGALTYGTLEGRVGITSARFHLEGRNAAVFPTAGLDVLARSA
jgi:hypothetical protein